MTEYDRGVLDGQESVDRELDACKDQLERVEKERDQAKLAEGKALLKLTAANRSMDRARELAEEGAARHKDYPEPAGCLLRVARLLSGDE